MDKRDEYRKGKLHARPRTSSTAAGTTHGLQRLDIGQVKECLLYVPSGYEPGRPVCPVLLLHGAGGNASHGLSYLQAYADENNLLLLAPASHSYSWDVIAADAFGTDVVFIDRVLSHVFSQYRINTRRIAIGGFSDGASYALCLGLSNGDLFSHIIAFSPGFSYTYEDKGKPVVFISHGVNDNVLPIGHCSRRIVPRLQQNGYDVLYKEFNGRHEIPPAIAQLAVDWYLDKQPATDRDIR